MWQALHRFATDDGARAEQAARGLETILARHTCGHRAEQLLGILRELGDSGAAGSLGGGDRKQGTGDILREAAIIASEAACT
jgi:hypothetical protein